MKGLIKKYINKMGFDIARKPLKSANPLFHHNIDFILDVGANKGQYALEVRALGYGGDIVSFEPLSSAHSQLVVRAQSDSKWMVHERVAVGAEAGEIEMNISENSHSSSILPISKELSQAEPSSAYISSEQVEVITLDSIYDQYKKSNSKVYLKLDTQGYEWEVLKGAKKCLKDIFAVQLELSTIALYQGQPLYDHYFKFFEENLFMLWSIIPGFSDSNTGQMLQFDAIFVRR